MRNLNEKVEKYLTGFTLMETMIAVSIFTLIMGTGLFMLVTGQRVYDRQDALMGVRFEAKRAMNRMVSELRNTGIGHIFILDAAGGHVPPLSLDAAGNPVLTSIPGSPLRLRFQLPIDYDGDGDVLDDWGNIEWGEPSSKQLNWVAEYTLSGNRLVRRVYNGLAPTTDAVQPSYETVLAGVPEDPIRPILITSLQFIGSSLIVPPSADSSADNSADSLALIEINLTTQCSTLKGRTMSSPLTASLSSKINFRN